MDYSVGGGCLSPFPCWHHHSLSHTYIIIIILSPPENIDRIDDGHEGGQKAGCGCGCGGVEGLWQWTVVVEGEGLYGITFRGMQLWVSWGPREKRSCKGMPGRRTVMVVPRCSNIISPTHHHHHHYYHVHHHPSARPTPHPIPFPHP